MLKITPETVPSRSTQRWAVHTEMVDLLKAILKDYEAATATNPKHSLDSLSKENVAKIKELLTKAG